MPAYLTRPERDGAYPGIVFVFEAFGLNAEMRRVADELAASGYVVMIPDLFSRGSWFGCIRRMVKDLLAESGRTVADLLVARDWLAGQGSVQAGRMAVMGLCIGGGFALVLSRTGLFQVAAPFYGTVPKLLDGACPIVASYGARDNVMAGGVPGLQAELERLDIANDVKIYPGVGHGFMTRLPNRLLATVCRRSPLHAAYDSSAAADAMDRLRRFLATHL